jgi:hypothetical protein
MPSEAHAWLLPEGFAAREDGCLLQGGSGLDAGGLGGGHDGTPWGVLKWQLGHVVPKGLLALWLDTLCPGL